MKFLSTSPVRKPEDGRRKAKTASEKGRRPPPAARRSSSGFTMIEIALCLAIIGFALVSILLVLPSGMHTQRDVRQETIISQDASMLLEAVRAGARGLDDLTNNVYAITNYVSFYDDRGVPLANNPHVWGYTYNAASYDGGPDVYAMHLTNGLRIVGLLSTPEFTLGNLNSGGAPIANGLGLSYTSNHVVAYVRSFSGLAADKPPQDNPIMQSDAFTYQLLCVNAPISFYVPPLWQAQAYNPGDSVTYIFYGLQTYWSATSAVQSTDVPGSSAKWLRVLYPQELSGNLRELRMTFFWPQLPNGGVGAFKQTFRTSVGGQLTATNYALLYPGIYPLYFYQPQSFSTNAP